MWVIRIYSTLITLGTRSELNNSCMLRYKRTMIFVEYVPHFLDVNHVAHENSQFNFTPS